MYLIITIQIRPFYAIKTTLYHILFRMSLNRTDSRTARKGQLPVSFYPAAHFEIIFGVPSKECRGFGICRLVLEEERDRLIRNSIFGRGRGIMILYGSSRALLSVHRGSLDKFTAHKQFGNGRFELMEAVYCELPYPGNNPLTSQKVMLLPGSYRIRTDLLYYEITLDIHFVGT